MNSYRNITTTSCQQTFKKCLEQFPVISPNIGYADSLICYHTAITQWRLARGKASSSATSVLVSYSQSPNTLPTTVMITLNFKKYTIVLDLCITRVLKRRTASQTSAKRMLRNQNEARITSTTKIKRQTLHSSLEKICWKSQKVDPRSLYKKIRSFGLCRSNSQLI